MDIQKYVSTGEDGSVSINKELFQSELDAEISRAVEKYRNGKGKDEIKKQLEEEARLTAEEKLKQERTDFEQYMLQAKTELAQAKAKAKMEGKGFTDKELEFILSTVSADEETSLAKIDELIAEREQVIAQTQKKAIESLQQAQQKTNTVVLAPDEKGPSTPQQRTKSEILSYYRPQQKNN